MHQICFEIGSLSIRWYGVMAAVGFMSAMFVLNYLRGYAALTSDQTANISLLAIFGGLLGARLFYVIQFWSKFRGHLLEVVRIDHGGLVFYGGFIVVTFIFLWYCNKHKLSKLAVLDIGAPALALGHTFGRIGCILNGCCFGKTTDLPWGVTYPHGALPQNFSCDVARHPVQLYESGMNFILFLVLFFLIGKLKRGRIAALYLICYGLIRFTDEFFRGDSNRIFNILTGAQVICLFLVPIGIILYIKSKNNERLTKTETDSSAGTEENQA